MAKILLVEDDTAVAETVLAFLNKTGQHSVDWASDGNKADEMLRFYKYELLILDWEVPFKSGIELLSDYRNRAGTASALMLTGKTAVSDRAKGLDTGADDYLCKPFDLEELGARVRALLRRGTNSKQSVLRVADIAIDLTARTVRKDGELIHLTPLEFSLFEFLVRHKGTMFSHEALLDRVWDSDSDAGVDMVRATIKRVRRKIGDSSEAPIIRNVFGEGYIVDGEADAE